MRVTADSYVLLPCDRLVSLATHPVLRTHADSYGTGKPTVTEAACYEVWRCNEQYQAECAAAIRDGGNAPNVEAQLTVAQLYALRAVAREAYAADAAEGLALPAAHYLDSVTC